MLLPAGIGVAELQLRPYIIQSLDLRYVIFFDEFEVELPTIMYRHSVIQFKVWKVWVVRVPYMLSTTNLYI